MISVVVCTRNRANLLKQCIDSLLCQSTKIPFEVIVVDNASSDDTKELVLSYMKNDKRVSYVYEELPSSSRARNTGVSISRYKYIGFVDDDGKVRTNFIEVAASVIDRFSFDCFGGWFIPWYITPKPKWFQDSYGSYPCFLSTAGILEHQHVPCGILFIKKDIFLTVGGFSENIGMKGEVMGYGEENLLQNSVRNMGGVIGFAPDLVLEHYVAEYKYNIEWHIKRFYAKGRDAQVMIGPLSLKQRLVYKVKAVVYCPFLLFKNLPKLVKKDYYKENLILDSLSFSVHLLGRSSVS